MNEAIKFYHNPISRRATVHWMLEEVEAEYEVILLDFKKKEHKTPHYLVLNPMGKIPTITHKGSVISEAAAICAYLADAFPQNKLSPPIGDSMRAPYLRWLFFSATCFEPALLDKMFSRTEIDKGSSGYGNYDDVMAALENLLREGPYILGNHFTAADVYLASQMSWGMMTKSLDARPAFQKYVNVCKERPAFQRFSLQSQEMITKLMGSA